MSNETSNHNPLTAGSERTSDSSERTLGVGTTELGYWADTEEVFGGNATRLPWDGARSAPLPKLRKPMNPSEPRLDVGATFAGKTILLIGTTGFVGKVALSMLLHRYPQVGRIYCLVRPGAGNTAEQRFYRKVASSEAFDPLRAVHGDNYEAFLRTKIVAIAGDIGRPLCNFTDEQFAEFDAAGGIHVVLNSAGLVSFMPSLESALRINALGAKNVLDTARKLGAKLVHVSTCYVAGRRDGDVWEDEEIVGYFPRKDDLVDRDFDPAAEIADCQRIIDQARERSNDRAHISEFREKAAKSLRDQKRDPDDDGDLKLGVARERKIWMNEVLTKLGMERSEHWGWTNTYTYTKSLGEQIILGDKSVVSTIVRPAVVESSIRFPFAGWNEGFNTTAPLVYLMLKGHRSVPGADIAFDAIPVDFIAAGMLLATAAILDGSHETVYQLGSSDSNRVSSARLVELTALAVRGHYKKKIDAGEDTLRSQIRRRLEGRPVTIEQFHNRSTPIVKKVAERLTKLLDEKSPKWGAPRWDAFAERARAELANVTRFTGQVNDLVELFQPFNYDHDIAFRADNIRALWARTTLADQDKLLWAPHLMNWRHYWIDVHFEGLKKWTFKAMDEEFGAKPRSVYTYKELVELFESTVKLHRNRVALRLVPKVESESDDDADVRRKKLSPWAPPARREAIAVTYGQMGELAHRGAGVLQSIGVTAGDKVMIMSENRPEWGITYFATMLAGAISVPLDSQLTLPEVENLIRVSRAKAIVLSRRVAERLAADAGLAVPAPEHSHDSNPLFHVWSPAHPALEQYFERVLGEANAQVLAYDELLWNADAPKAGVVAAAVKGDSTASLIFTSGTTGQPKGVMLSHKNFTAMASKLSSLFQLYKHDRLLSVLPMHHTFEFSAGFLMPLAHGACIDYLEEVEAESLAAALKDEGITGMVGVPALWQLLERKIYKNVADAGPLVEKAFDAVIDANRNLRDKLPWDIGAGKALFFPVHRKLGGRMRLLISGGSALPPETMKSFRGLGFDLFEGYGMTEAAPVLTVTRPGDKVIPGSVGRPLPGIDVKIDQPDVNGIGEVIAKGPNVMSGYFENQEATDATLQNGWLHTGDLGRIDEEGNLYIVGRKKEMILGPSGENVYPDELEELFGDSPFIKEISVVGLPGEAGLETVAALVVPDYEHDENLSREQVRENVREHIRKVGKAQPLYKRLKTVHLWDFDLPKTSTRKVKRREIVKELQKLEKAARGGAEAKRLSHGADGVATTPADAGSWVWNVVAEVSQKPKTSVNGETRLDQLGFDSLMFNELAVALEAAGVTLPDPSELIALETVADVEALVTRLGVASAEARKRTLTRKKVEPASDDINVPQPLVRAGRRVLSEGMFSLYDKYLSTRVYGTTQVPPTGGFIVAANHASHLDTGLVKFALGEQGDVMVALAAKDYFFEDPVRRMYFENFTNLVPMERHGSLRESLRLAGDVIRQGYILLIFPEGTRSDTGVMTDFKPSLGYLAMTNKCGILPMYLSGTHGAMPKGKYLPKRGGEVAAHVGPFVSYEQVQALAKSAPSRSEQYGAITAHVESTVRRLAPRADQWTLGDAGTMPMNEYLASIGSSVAAESTDASENNQ